MTTIDRVQNRRDSRTVVWIHGKRASRLFLAHLLAGVVAAAAQGGPDYSAASASIFIPYVNQQSATFVDVPQLMLNVTTGVNGSAQNVKALPVRMDTGSTGILISSGLIPGYETLRSSGKPGQQFYSSSKILSVGTWVPVTVTFYDNSGTTELATASVPVLGVEQSGKCPSYEEENGSICPCKAGTNTCPCMDDPGRASCACPASNVCPLPPALPGKAYMGVGFGREEDHMPQATPDKNPFLNLTTIAGKPISAGTFNPGYIVGGTGVTLGLTTANTQGFNWLKLSPSSTFSTPQYPEWDPANMCVQVNNLDCSQGSLLVDTGVSNVYINLPQSDFSKIPTMPGTEKDPSGAALPVFAIGNSVTVKVATQPNPVAYFFKVENAGTSSDPQADPQVIPSYKAGPNDSFINTGRRFLCQFQLLYDYKNGFFGLKPQSSNICSE